MMVSLLIVVEGQTEEAFVNDVLVPHLRGHHVEATPIIVKTKVTPTGSFRGGGKFSAWRKDLRILKSDHRKDLRITSLFDLYGLPSDFPEHGLLASLESLARAERAEAILAREVADDRFIPYVQRHEFEALVLASLDMLRTVVEESEQKNVDALKASIAGLAPEDVNGGATTAPSKRLLAALPSYQKVVHGPLATQATGLSAIRQLCPRFNNWVSRLEQLGTDAVVGP